MGDIGFETWSYVILHNLGQIKKDDKATRLMVEKMFIRELSPQLNIRNNLRMYKKWQIKQRNREYKGGRSKRPVIRIRKKLQPDEQRTKELHLTTYELTEVYNPRNMYTTHIVENYIKTLKHGHTYSLRIATKGHIITSWDYVMNNIGSSQVITTRPAITLKHFLFRIKTSKFKCITFKCNKSENMRNNIDESILRLQKNDTHIRRELTYDNGRNVLYLWAKIQNLTNWKLKRIALNKIGKYLKKFFYSTRLPSPINIFEYTSNTNISYARQVCRYATSKVLHREIAYEINKSIKFIPRRGKSIAECLVNAKELPEMSISPVLVLHGVIRKIILPVT
jgi:hypothetical protein